MFLNVSLHHAIIFDVSKWTCNTPSPFRHHISISISIPIIDHLIIFHLSSLFLLFFSQSKFGFLEIPSPSTPPVSSPPTVPIPKDCIGSPKNDARFNSFPRNIQDAMEMADDSIYATVITEPLSPFLVTYVNKSWEDLCGYTRDDVIGCSLSCIQGTHTKSTTLAKLSMNLRKNLDSATRLTNYKKSGEAFENMLRIVPLKNRIGRTTHFFGTLEEYF